MKLTDKLSLIAVVSCFVHNASSQYQMLDDIDAVPTNSTCFDYGNYDIDLFQNGFYSE